MSSGWWCVMDTACQRPGAVEGPGIALKEKKVIQRGSQHIGSAGQPRGWAAAPEAAQPLKASVGLHSRAGRTGSDPGWSWLGLYPAVLLGWEEVVHLQGWQ